MNIRTPRNYYRPFDYPFAYDAYRKQQSVHWTKDEISLSKDLNDWTKELSDTEREVVGGILKGFVQAEVLVGDYWRKVADWFPKPEIQMMSATFSYFEGIHIDNYAMLNEELKLDNFKEFVQDETTKAKLDYLINVPLETTDENIAKSIAIFSAFTEGVLIYSSFAVLLSFQLRNTLRGISQIVSFSIRDENFHSENGIKLFNTMCDESDEDLLNLVKEDIINAAKIVYQLEEQFIDSIFKGESISTLNPYDLKQFIKHRINIKLNELRLDGIFEIDEESIKRMNWFYLISGSREFTDFFSGRVTEYSKNEYQINDLF
jgi:ribonucleoside-diphosphate reductase beta chain